MRTKRINCNQIEVVNKNKTCVITLADGTLWMLLYGGPPEGLLQANQMWLMQIKKMYQTAAHYLDVREEDLQCAWTEL